jgi:ABC-type Fe3+/spermidine/putrescine transport system ATPase subunit
VLGSLTLKVDRISRALGTFRLRRINFEVGTGEYFVLLGPTGAGKTALLEVIMGFHRPDEGRIYSDGQDVTDVPTEKRGIGYVPQNCPLFPHMNVFENVEFGLKMQRVEALERRRSVDRMLEIMGLEAMSKRTPSTLSGGERQKAVLARVLVTRPKAVLLDEPLASIDAETNRVLREELKRINRELKVAIVHVTHDQIEAFSLGDRIAIIRNGEIAQLGHPAAVLASPANEFVARFLGYENVFRARFVKHGNNSSEVAVDSITIRLASKLEYSEATIAVRPEEIVVTAKSPLFSEEWNIFEGTITGYIDLGPVVDVNVDAGLALKALVDKRSFLKSDLAVGKRVCVGFRADSVKVLGAR